jgi:hypothetical protein
MRIKSQQDLLAGLVFVAVGVAFVLAAQVYPMGRTARMGPGYFPTLLAACLILVGLVVAGRSLAGPAVAGSAIGRIAWRQLACILGAGAVFAVSLGGIPSFGVPSMGLLVGSVGVVVLASLAGGRLPTARLVVLAAGLALFSWLVFVKGLGLLIPVWPAFVGP